MKCLFCQIAAGEIESRCIYEDDTVYGFYDIDPAAPTHFLVIPKEHIASINEIEERQESIVGHMMAVAGRLAQELGLEGGYRVVSNVGKNGGQSVHHLHLHVMGGRKFSWPPG